MGRVLVIVGGALLLLAGWLAVSQVHSGGFACGGTFSNGLASDIAITQGGGTLRDASACDSARSSRRTLTIGLGIVGLGIGTAGVVAVRRETEAASTRH